MDGWRQLIDTPQLLALAAALGWASGVRLYLAVFLAGAAGYLGWIDLPQGLRVLQHPGVLAASGFMAFTEFFADKIPLVDSVWDMVHTLIRIPAGAALAAGALGADSQAMGWIASLLEDGFVVFMLWLSATHPVIFAIALVLTLVVAVLLMIVLVKFLRAVIARLRQFFESGRVSQGRMDV